MGQLHKSILYKVFVPVLVIADVTMIVLSASEAATAVEAREVTAGDQGGLHDSMALLILSGFVCCGSE